MDWVKRVERDRNVPPPSTRRPDRPAAAPQPRRTGMADTSRYEQYWRGLSRHGNLKRWLWVSILFHVGLIASGLTWSAFRPAKHIVPIYEVALGTHVVEGVEDLSLPLAEEPPPTAPAPSPEPTPPPKVEQVTPPKPEPVPEKKAEPKPEKKAEPKKEEKKPESKKEEPKKEPKKAEQPAATKPAPAIAKAEATKPGPLKPGTVGRQQGIGNVETGVSAHSQFPTALGVWGRNMQRKIQRAWQVPGGIQLGQEPPGAIVQFTVDRNGNVIGQPRIITPAANPAVGASAVRAIIESSPFPPLPPDYTESYVNVELNFVPNV